jgi:hypothetical protein
MNKERHISDPGPQSPSDNPFTAKARKHQSLWRVQNGLEIGIGPNKNSVDRKTGLPTYYGNMIKDGELTGRNFYFPETFAYAQWRVNTKLKDETIDEYRLFNNLMSSMPMAFNLFHPLMMMKTKEPSIIDKMIKAAFPQIKSIYKVLEIGLEFIPTPIEKYTGDKSAMDALIRFQDIAGNNYLIAIETKYTDSLGINTASDKLFQKQLDIIRELDMFNPDSIELIRNKELAINQIYRNFILAEKYSKVHSLHGVYSVILAPKDHPTTKEEVKSLQSHLKDEYKYKIMAFALEDFTLAIQEHCPADFQEWIIWFRDRYID